MTERQRLVLVSLVFFISGAASLIYQVVWGRMLSLTFGSTAAAAGVVLAAFMGGLALGAYVGGKYADRFPGRVMVAFVGVETGIALYGLAFPVLVGSLTPLYRAMQTALGASGPTMRLLMGVGALVLLLVPTALMGATLPLLVKRFCASGAGVGARTGLLYGVKTSGALVGCLLTGLVALPALGMFRTTLLAVGMNALAAAAAGMWGSGPFVVRTYRRPAMRFG